MILVIGTWFADATEHFLADVVAAVTCLGQCFAQLLEAQTLDFDVHLAGCNAVLRSGHLEVHIAQVVLVTQDIGEYNVLPRILVGDQSHCDAGYRRLDRHTAIHEGQGTRTYGRHGGRTV